MLKMENKLERVSSLANLFTFYILLTEAKNEEIREQYRKLAIKSGNELLKVVFEVMEKL